MHKGINLQTISFSYFVHKLHPQSLLPSGGRLPLNVPFRSWVKTSLNYTGTEACSPGSVCLFWPFRLRVSELHTRVDLPPGQSMCWCWHVPESFHRGGIFSILSVQVTNTDTQTHPISVYFLCVFPPEKQIIHFLVLGAGTWRHREVTCRHARRKKTKTESFQLIPTPGRAFCGVHSIWFHFELDILAQWQAGLYLTLPEVWLIILVK